MGFQPPRLPAGHPFDIEAEAYRALSAQRAEALRRGMGLPDEEGWHPAQVHLQGARIQVRIKLAGNNADHWREGKWSLQVQIQDGPTLLGMQSFVLQSPATCGYLNSWLYSQDLRHAGILVPQHTFANVAVNGDDWGVYALVERASREFLASQSRSEGALVRWDRRSPFVDSPVTAFDMPLLVQVDDLTSRGQVTEVRKLVCSFQDGTLPASQVFDPELIGRQLAHADLWGAGWLTARYDEFYYYSPSKARLEPVGSTAFPLEPATESLVGPTRYDDLAIIEAYAREALHISQPEYLEAVREAQLRVFERYYAALVQEFFPAYLEAPWKELAGRQEILLAALDPPQTVSAYPDSDESHSTIDVRVANLLHHPVVLQELRLGERAASVQYDWVSEDGRALLHREARPFVILRAAQEAVPRCITLRIPVSVIDELTQNLSGPSGALQLVTHLVGAKGQVVVIIPRDVSLLLPASILPTQPSLEQALARYPFLEVSEQPGFLNLKPGTWHIEGDLALPDGFGIRATQSVT